MTIEAGVLGISDMQIAPEKPPTNTTRTLASSPTSTSYTNKNMDYAVVLSCPLAHLRLIMTESHNITQHSTTQRKLAQLLASKCRERIPCAASVQVHCRACAAP